MNETPIPIHEIVEASHHAMTVGRAVSALVGCSLTWFLILIAYGYKNSENGFHLLEYIKQKHEQIVLGLVMTLGIGLLKLTSDNIDQFLALLGFQPGPNAAVSIGLAIAAFLLSIGRKKNGNKNQKSSTQS